MDKYVKPSQLESFIRQLLQNDIDSETRLQDIINALEQILPAAIIAGLNECPIKLNLTIGNKAFTEEAAMKVIKLLSLGTSNKAAMKGA